MRTAKPASQGLEGVDNMKWKEARKLIWATVYAGGTVAIFLYLVLHVGFLIAIGVALVLVGLPDMISITIDGDQKWKR